MQKPLNEVKNSSVVCYWKEYKSKFAVDNKSVFENMNWNIISENLAQV